MPLHQLIIKSRENDAFIVSGYASVFDIIDSHNDIMLHGAFAESLSSASFKQDIKFLWQHDPQKPIGIVRVLKEDHYGLYFEGAINRETQCGKEAIALLEQGALNGLSIGFIAKDAAYNINGLREVMNTDLKEISLVTFPANHAAHIMDMSTALDKALSIMREITSAF